MAEPRRFRRKYSYNSDYSVAASSEETLINMNFQGILRSLTIKIDGADGTFLTTSKINTIVDGTERELTLQKIFRSMGMSSTPSDISLGNEIQAGKLIIHQITAASHIYYFTMVMDSEISENFTLTFTNTDAAAAAEVRIGIHYDEEL